jgi:hypothetical protein
MSCDTARRLEVALVLEEISRLMTGINNENVAYRGQRVGMMMGEYGLEIVRLARAGLAAEVDRERHSRTVASTQLSAEKH